MLELVGLYGEPSKTCHKTLSSILVTLELTSPPSPSIFLKLVTSSYEAKINLLLAGSSQIIAQYYQLIRFGQEGYRRIMENCRENAMVVKEDLEKTGRFKIVSKDKGVPVVAFCLKDKSRYDEFKISEILRRHGWIVPAYPMPPAAEHINVLRVVIRAEFSRTLAERLVLDIQSVLDELEKRKKGWVETGVKNTALDALREIIAQESKNRQKIMAA
ncbi:Glutamate decarboxylase 3, partial [Mucuna pruriens]